MEKDFFNNVKQACLAGLCYGLFGLVCGGLTGTISPTFLDNKYRTDLQKYFSIQSTHEKNLLLEEINRRRHQYFLKYSLYGFFGASLIGFGGGLFLYNEQKKRE